VTEPKKYKSILIVSDVHAPHMHKDAVSFLKAVKAKFKPDMVVFSGDEADFHNLSYHDSDPDLDSAGVELEKTIEQLKPLYKLFPSAYIMESNHGSMVLRKALTHGLPSKVIKSYNEILNAPKTWRWVPDIVINSPLGPVYFCHGKSGAAGRLASQYGMSCVQGHFHEKAQITYISTPHSLMFDMHVACLVDDNSRAMAYNKINPRRPILSIGVIINGIPQIVPMVLNKQGRWIGSL
jgi:hypothetical protein